MKPDHSPRQTRRDFLRASSAIAFPALLSNELLAADDPTLIVRQKTPVNLEFPFASLDSFITPNDEFFVRTRFPIPKLKAEGWRLRVEGAVKQPLTLSLDEIRRLSAQTITATLECAGNSRAFLDRKRGVPWQYGAVSNATWTGVLLSTILEKAGLREKAVEIVFEGADEGEISSEPELGKVAYARSLPVAKAKQANVLLAYRMNNKELPVSHGFPLRAIVSGWYGMASVKWLKRIIVSEQPFGGYYQTFSYTFFEKKGGLVTVKPITEQLVKSLIARPHPGEKLAANVNYRIHGAAWTGDAEIARVEVSMDGGKSWQAARLTGKSARFCWRLWELPWRTPKKANKLTLMCRATDSNGQSQPMRRDPARRNYLVNHVLPVEVVIG